MVLNIVIVFARFISSGIESHSFGDACKKVRSPKVDVLGRDEGTASGQRWEERKVRGGWWISMSDVKYCLADPQRIL